MKTDLYLFRCITNLHAGSGDSNYGIVDKEVQRDPIDETPIVLSTSLKGAFREQFDAFKESAGKITQDGINEIFGTDSKAEVVDPKDWVAGQYFFYPAQLLFYPVRSNVQPYFYATSKALLKKFISSQEDMGTNTRADLETWFKPFLDLNPKKEHPLVFTNEANKPFIDEYQAIMAPAGVTVADGALPEGITLNNLALFHEDDLKETCKRLPVIARNQLKHGLSENLWYEEIVPRESRFYFFVSRPDTSDLFEEGLTHDQIQHKTQIGGNASIGYGLCKLQRINVEVRPQ